MLLFGLIPAWTVAQDDTSQSVRHETPPAKKKDPGPRALALVEVTSSGHGTVFPIAILVDGKFYDASAYKGTPAPLALEPGTVYEGMRNGKPQGLLTISSVLHGDTADTKYRWLGKGTWMAEGAIAANAAHKAETTPVGLEAKDEAPRLSKAPATPTAASSPSPAQDSTQKPPATESAPAPSTESKPATKSAEPDSKLATANDEGPVRLRRGKPSQPLPEEKDEPHGILQTMLAISDADVRETVSFQYSWEKTERDAREKQIELLAQDALRAYLKSQASHAEGAAKPVSTMPPGKPKPASKPATVLLDKVSLVACDVWHGNQPVVIYSAEAEVSEAHNANQRPDASTSKHYFVIVVARSDIYGNLKQLFAGVTDPQHLDVTPRMEFVDAVDADGDGRGELVFREITDSASGYVIYKPAADSLWKMYDSLNLQ